MSHTASQKESSTMRIPYFVQSHVMPDGRATHRLMIAHREGRGVISSPSIDELLDETGVCRGYLFNIVGQDHLRESLGSLESPLPVDLIEAALSDAGLPIVFIDMENEKLIGGQILYIDEIERNVDTENVREGDELPPSPRLRVAG